MVPDSAGSVVLTAPTPQLPLIQYDTAQTVGPTPLGSREGKHALKLGLIGYLHPSHLRVPAIWAAISPTEEREIATDRASAILATVQFPYTLYRGVATAGVVQTDKGSNSVFHHPVVS
eukprot:2965431-Rhodomonas_salina.2